MTAIQYGKTRVVRSDLPFRGVEPNLSGVEPLVRMIESAAIIGKPRFDPSEASRDVA
jgi:hypothetical protein